MRWGAMVPAGAAEFPRENRTALWFRELWPAPPRLLVPEARRLIIVEDFALPDGPPGARPRTWYGLEDKPVFAWAGVWSVSGGVSAYCGFLVAGASPLYYSTNLPSYVPPHPPEA